MSIRKGIFWIHLLIGVLAGVVILIMSATGVLLAFESQILNRAESGMREVTVPVSSAQPLGLDRLVEIARAEFPDIPPSGITLRAEPNASVLVSFGRENVFYLNPYSGEILGRGSKLRGIMRQIESLHRSLGAQGQGQNPGRALTGACNLGFFLLTISGLYLWWPRNWSWRVLRPSVWFTRGVRGKARDWNWHNVIGLWTAPILGILTLTGVIMSYQWANNALFKLTGNAPPARGDRGGGARRDGKDSRDHDERANRPHDDHKPRGDRQPATLSGLVAEAQQRVPNWTTLSLRLAQQAGSPITATIQDSGSAFGFYRSQLTLDPLTAGVIKWEPFATQNVGRKARTWARFLHTGEAGGILGQGIAALASAGGVMLVWTGIAMAWRRFFGAKSKGKGNSNASSPHDGTRRGEVSSPAGV